jgi:hypothetical protein
MGKQTLIEKIDKLPPEQLAEVEKFVDALDEQQREQQFQQRLLKLGIISEIKPPITDFTPYQNRQPIEVKGKPTSEVIIEDRR